MGQLKDEAGTNTNEDVQQFKLLDGEANYLRLLNLSLQYHTLGQKIMSGYLYYVCTQRLGYKDGSNLAFEFDFNNPANELIVKLLPANLSPATAPTATPQDGEAPAAQ